MKWPTQEEIDNHYGNRPYPYDLEDFEDSEAYAELTGLDRALYHESALENKRPDDSWDGVALEEGEMPDEEFEPF